MATIFKNYDDNICLKFLSFSYEQNINKSDNTMTKL